MFTSFLHLGDHKVARKPGGSGKTHVALSRVHWLKLVRGSLPSSGRTEGHGELADARRTVDWAHVVITSNGVKTRKYQRSKQAGMIMNRI